MMVTGRLLGSQLLSRLSMVARISFSFEAWKSSRIARSIRSPSRAIPFGRGLPLRPPPLTYSWMKILMAVLDCGRDAGDSGHRHPARNCGARAARRPGQVWAGAQLPRAERGSAGPARAVALSLGCQEVYVADLDALEETGDNLVLVAALVNHVGGVHLLVDAGLRSAADARRLLDIGVGRVVLASESSGGPHQIAEIGRAA